MARDVERMQRRFVHRLAIAVDENKPIRIRYAAASSLQTHFLSAANPLKYAIPATLILTLLRQGTEMLYLSDEQGTRLRPVCTDELW